MEAVHNETFLSVEDYLEGEKKVRFATSKSTGPSMYGLRQQASSSDLPKSRFALETQPRGKPCQVSSESFKLQLEVGPSEIFYYPDLMVTCDPRDIDEYVNITQRF